MAGYDTWKAREPDPWEYEDQPDTADIEEPLLPEDFRFTADLLRRYARTDQSLFQAVCHNNLAMILEALDRVGKEAE